ncbi:MAG: hypothetical protein OHK0017_09110 [Patescibacteria group bacterium]
MSKKNQNNVSSTNPDNKKKWIKFGIRASLIVALLAVLIFSGLTGYALWRSQKAVDKVVIPSSSGSPSVLGTVIEQVQHKEIKLKGQDEGRTNFLLIGTDYGQRTDTNIVASYFWKTNKLTMVNLPRDFKIYNGKEYSKINAYMYSGANTDSVKEEGLAKFIGKELDIPIHYWASIDIDGVAKLVDTVGGIEVNVESSFTDCMFPTKDYSDYMRPCPNFEAGKQTMNGDRAVIYARSRHSFNNPKEAIDFARSRRQTIVIQALAEKLMSQLNVKGISQNVDLPNQVLGIMENHLRISITPGELLALNKHIKESESGLQVGRYINGYGSILCDDKISSDIPYCDGNVGGTTVKSKSREQLREIVRNIENYAFQDAVVKK